MKKILFTLIILCVLLTACGKNNTEKSVQPDYVATQELSMKSKVDELITKIVSSPLESSNPRVYIDAHKEEYNELVAMDKEALRVIFIDFATYLSDANSLEDFIKMLAARDILGEEDIEFELGSPYDWYNEYKNYVLSAYEQNDIEVLEGNLPKSCVLLEILGKK